MSEALAANAGGSANSRAAQPASAGLLEFMRRAAHCGIPQLAYLLSTSNSSRRREKGRRRGGEDAGTGEAGACGLWWFKMGEGTLDLERSSRPVRGAVGPLRQEGGRKGEGEKKGEGGGKGEGGEGVGGEKEGEGGEGEMREAGATGKTRRKGWQMGGRRGGTMPTSLVV